MKRILSLALALVLVIALLPVSAQAAQGDKLIALTFDDGPHVSYTEKLLDGLKELGAKCTFFMQGYHAQDYIDIVERAYDEGHEIANHTWSHQNLPSLGYSGVQSNLSSVNAVFDTVCGSGTRYILRPPGGDYNSTVCSASGTPIIYWSVDTRDWESRNYYSVYNHIVNYAYDGAIVLCHDIHTNTIPAAIDAVRTLQAQGYEFVTVSELFRRKGVEMVNGQVYSQCTGATVYDQVAAPVITYEAHADGAKVTIESPDGASVYYNLDGSRINQQSAVYTEPFIVDCPAEITAVAAFNLNGGRSETATLDLELLPCTAPEAELVDGQLILTTQTDGAPIHYTLDGTFATMDSDVYTGPVLLDTYTFITALAGGGNYEESGTIVLFYSSLGNLFADVFPGQWFMDAIDQLAYEGMMKGLGNNEFGPDEAITRAQLVELLYRYDGEPGQPARTNAFTDVADEDWYALSVEWAYANGIVDGYPEGDFRPDNNISRQEMAKIIEGFLAYRENGLAEAEDQSERFADGSAVAGWAKESVNAVVAAGLMNGDEKGQLRPEGTATRAEFATVLLRVRDLEEKLEQEREEAEKETEPTEPEETEPTEPETTESTQPRDNETEIG